MPHSAARPHPFNAACGKYSLHTSGFLILDRTVMNDGERGDSGMGMPAEAGQARRGKVKEIQKHEWLDELANIRRADQARDGSVPLPAAPKHNGALGKHSSVPGKYSRALGKHRRALGEGRFQYRAQAAIAAMFARAFNMAASLASAPKASPSARTTVTSVNPMNDSTPVR